MELLVFSVTLPNILLAFAVVLVMAAARLKKSKSTMLAPLPPGPWRFPILGNIPNLAGTEVPHQRLAELSKKHGPVMLLQLGQIPTVVVSSPDAAQAFLKTHDLNFADRPALLASRELVYDRCDLAFAPYGDYWRAMKKITVVELLTVKRVASFGHVRDAAVSMVLDEALRADTEPINLSWQFRVMGSWIVSRAAFGLTNSKQDLDNIVQVMSEVMSLSGSMSLADFFPSFESIICAVTGEKRKMREVFLRMDGMLDSIVRERLSRFETGDIDEQDHHDRDLLDLLLMHYRLQDLGISFSIDNVKALVMDLFIAGIETFSSTLDWAMTEMMRNPNVMIKAQTEVRRIYHEKGKIDESIVEELSYLKLVIKETLRVHPPVPLLVPRECRETCEINGYLIPAKTRVLVNAWALGRDPEYWVKPDDFDPERFLNESLDYKGTDHKYLPFGAGRRMCPGVTFGIASIDITLAKLLCHFDWKLPHGLRPQDLSMEETCLATLQKKAHLCLVASPIIPF